MSKRRLVAVLLSSTAFLAACGSSDDSASVAPVGPVASASLDSDVVAVGAAPVAGDGGGSLRDAVEVMAGAPAQADAAACVVDRQTLETASEAYYVLHGTDPASQNDLVTDQLIRELSPRFEITPDGVIVPVPGGPCT